MKLSKYSPLQIAKTNLILAFLAYLFNYLIQVFCQPVTWASIVLILFLIFFIGNHWISRKHPVLSALSMFFHGVGLCICVYCVFFIWEDYFIASFIGILFLIGILAQIPLFFGFQIIKRIINVRKKSILLTSFLVGIILPFLITYYFVTEYDKITYRMSRIDQNNIDEMKSAITNEYLGERILGMHFRYHTRALIELDGWRPPLHDPLLVLGMRFSRIPDPIPRYSRLNVYSNIFPKEPIKADCICAFVNGYRYRYWNPSDTTTRYPFGKWINHKK